MKHKKTEIENDLRHQSVSAWLAFDQYFRVFVGNVMCQTKKKTKKKKVHSDNSIEQGMTTNGNESNIMLVPKLMLKCNAGTLSNECACCI
jgi:hypothetical protein